MHSMPAGTTRGIGISQAKPDQLIECDAKCFQERAVFGDVIAFADNTAGAASPANGLAMPRTNR